MRIIIKASLLCGLIALSAPAFAQIHLGINFGPPRARHEVVDRRGHEGSVWIAGNYEYNDNDRNYAWRPGRWEAPPAEHQVWSAPRYKRHGDHYDYYKGEWRDKGNNRGQSKQQGKQGNHGRD